MYNDNPTPTPRILKNNKSTEFSFPTMPPPPPPASLAASRKPQSASSTATSSKNDQSQAAVSNSNQAPREESDYEASLNKYEI